MRNPTLHDVARAAGVSYSTADRVLNTRGGVAEKSVLRVQRAIEELGYQRDVHAANLSRRRVYDFRFYLPFGDHSFFSVLRDAVEAQAAARIPDRVRIAIHDVPPLDSDALASELMRIETGDCDCVAIIGSDSPALTEAVGRLAELRIPVVTLISDAAPDLRALYVGINNCLAGRTAGRLTRLAHSQRNGLILPILGRLNARDHRDRLQGFCEVIAEKDAGMRLLPVLEVHDRPERMQELLGAALATWPGITGIYSIGAGNRALIHILEQLGPERPFAVLHELTPLTRTALAGGVIDAVIDQKPAEEVGLALDAMKAIADDRPPLAAEIIPMIYLRDNLPT